MTNTPVFQPCLIDNSSMANTTPIFQPRLIENSSMTNILIFQPCLIDNSSMTNAPVFQPRVPSGPLNMVDVIENEAEDHTVFSQSVRGISGARCPHQPLTSDLSR